MTYQHLNGIAHVEADLNRFSTTLDAPEQAIRREIEHIDAVLANITDSEASVRRALIEAEREAADLLGKLTAKRARYTARRDTFTAALDRVML